MSTMRELAQVLVGDVLGKVVATAGGEGESSRRRAALEAWKKRGRAKPETEKPKRPPIKGFASKDARNKWPSGRGGGEGVYYIETPKSVDEGEMLVRVAYDFQAEERQTRDEPGADARVDVIEITDADGQDITHLYNDVELEHLEDKIRVDAEEHLQGERERRAEGEEREPFDKAISPSAAHRRSKLAWQSRRHGPPGVYIRPEAEAKKPVQPGMPEPEAKIDDAAAYAKLSPRDQLREKAKAGGRFAWHDEGLSALIGASRDTPLKTVAGRVVATDGEIDQAKKYAYAVGDLRAKNYGRVQDEQKRRNADIDTRGQDEGHRQHLRRMINMANAITDWDKATTRGHAFNEAGMLDAARLFWHRGALLYSEGKHQAGKPAPKPAGGHIPSAIGKHRAEPIELSDIFSPRWARPHSLLAAPSPPTHRPL